MASSNSLQSAEPEAAIISQPPILNSDPPIGTTTSEDRIHTGNVPDAAEGEEREDEGECGFCLFMKGGGCRDTFTEWEKCVDEGERNNENIAEKCFQATSALKKCMEAHPDYYSPILRAEEEAAKQLEEEKERPNKEQEEDLRKNEKEEDLNGSNKMEMYSRFDPVLKVR